MIEIIPNWHPFFVHFTLGLLSTAVLFYWASAFLSNRYSWKQQWLTMANWCLWTGCLFAIATATAGWLAYNSVAHDAASHAAMTLHRNWALPTAGVFLLLGIWAIILANRGRRPGFLFLIFSLTAAGMLAFTGWLGAEAVYRYGLGVKSMPVVEEGADGHNHSHSHGSMHDESNGDKHDHNAEGSEGMISRGVVGKGADGHNHSHSTMHDENNEAGHNHNTVESEPVVPVEDHSLHNPESQKIPVKNEPVPGETAGHSHKMSAASKNNTDQHIHNSDDTHTIPVPVEQNTSTTEKNPIPSEHHHTHKHGEESPAHHHH